MLKSHFALIAGALAVTGCVTISTAPAVDTGTLPSTNCAKPADTARLSRDIARATTAFRAGLGLGALSYDDRLAVAAQAHACELAARGGELTHAGLDGSTSFARAQRAGFPARLIAENLAWGRFDAQGVVDGWAGSPGHRANMVHPRIERIGVAVANGPRGPVWVQVMGR